MSCIRSHNTSHNVPFTQQWPSPHHHVAPMACQNIQHHHWPSNKSLDWQAHYKFVIYTCMFYLQQVFYQKVVTSGYGSYTYVSTQLCHCCFGQPSVAQYFQQSLILLDLPYSIVHHILQQQITNCYKQQISYLQKMGNSREVPKVQQLNC